MCRIENWVLLNINDISFIKYSYSEAVSWQVYKFNIAIFSDAWNNMKFASTSSFIQFNWVQDGNKDYWRIMIDFLEATTRNWVICIGVFTGPGCCATPSLKAFSPWGSPGYPRLCPSQKENFAQPAFQTCPKCFGYTRIEAIDLSMKEKERWKRIEVTIERPTPSDTLKNLSFTTPS